MKLKKISDQSESPKTYQCRQLKLCSAVKFFFRSNGNTFTCHMCWAGWLFWSTCHMCTRGPRVQIKIWKTFGRTRLCTCALNCSVLAVVAEEFVCGIASCEGRLLEEVELREYVESCCAFLPYTIYNNGFINRNSNHLIICSLAGDRRNGITAVLSTKIKTATEQTK